MNVAEYSKNYNRFLFITLKLLVFLIYNYILFITFEVVYIYILYTCFLGLGIGSAVLYGVQENTNRKKFLILTFFFSFLSFLMFFIIYKLPVRFYREFRLFLSIRPLPMYVISFCLISLIIVGAVFYRKSKYTNKQLLFILIIVSPLFAYLFFNHIVYLCDMYDWSKVSNYEWVKFYLIPLPILYPCFLALGTRMAISYRLIKSNHINKKTIFVLIPLYSIFAYVVTIVAIYFSNICREISFSDFAYFLRLAIEETPVYADPPSSLSIMINGLIWIAEFFITSFSAWLFIIFTCPWLSPLSQSKLEEIREE